MTKFWKLCALAGGLMLAVPGLCTPVQQAVCPVCDDCPAWCQDVDLGGVINDALDDFFDDDE